MDIYRCRANKKSLCSSRNTFEKKDRASRYMMPLDWLLVVVSYRAFWSLSSSCFSSVFGVMVQYLKCDTSSSSGMLSVVGKLAKLGNDNEYGDAFVQEVDEDTIRKRYT